MITRHHKPKPLKLTAKQVQSLPCDKGLGDKVERIAQPIAKAIDRVFKTNIQECGACKKRKAYLNKKFPT